MKNKLILWSFLLAATVGGFAFIKNSRSKQPVRAYKPFVVLELFTSEGCSSCPPADAALKSVANEENVYALGFHVTYWNRLGWKDQFSAGVNDERQYQYAEKFKQSGVYTPQMVINGQEEFVGSKKNQIDASIRKYLAETPTADVQLTCTVDADKIYVAYHLQGDFKNKALHLALVERNITSKILRGENEGKTLQHDNIVRDFETVNIASDAAGAFQFTKNASLNPNNLMAIAYLQDPGNMKIIGGSKVSIK